MKCHVCSYEIPEGRKYCPGCGRVVRQANTVNKYEPTFEEPRMPAPVRRAQDDMSTGSITDIFSTDPNVPEYRDPHAYDTATAHVLEYDRMFVSRSSDREKSPLFTDDSTKRFSPVYAEPEADERHIIIEPEAAFDEYDAYAEEETAEEEAPRRKRSGSSSGKNVVISIVIAVAVVVGLAFCFKGVYEIGKQFGFWDDESTNQTVQEDNTDKEKLPANRPAQTVEDEENNGESDYETGVYTIKSDQKNIFVYKSFSDQRITATIPNGTVIEITEIRNDLGKTTYNSYSGWVEMTDLVYTPDKEPAKPEETTTAAEAVSEEIPAFPTEPGIYTVTLSGETPLNVRDTGSTDGVIVTTVANGTQLEVTEIRSSWGKVIIDGVEGWVYMEYMR